MQSFSEDSVSNSSNSGNVLRLRRTITPAVSIVIAFIVQVAPAIEFDSNPPKRQPSPKGAQNALLNLNQHLSPQTATGLPMKLRSILQGEFEFYRGTADLYYLWCAEHCRNWADDESVFVQLHGDVHIGNIGTLRVTGPGGTSVGFGLVDLDETIRGPFQLDLLRGAVSLRFAARDQKRPLADESWHRIVAAMCQEYSEAISGNTLSDRLIAEHREIRALIDEATSGKPWKHAKKYLAGKKGDQFASVRFKKKKPSDIMEPIDANLTREIIGALWDARDLGGKRLVQTFGITDRAQLESTVRDVAHWTRLGSAGSQGLDKYLVLLNRKAIGEDGPFIIELKEEPSPAAMRSGYLKAAGGGLARAREVAEGHEKLWPQNPWCVGYCAIGDKGFLVRAKGPWAEELDEDDFDGFEGALRAARIIGSAVGTAHVASIKRGGGEAVIGEIRKRLVDLPDEIEKKGKDLDKYIRAAYNELKHDPEAIAQVKKADAYIQSATRSAKQD